MEREKIDTLKEKDFVTSLIMSDKCCKVLIPYINLSYFQIEYSRIILDWVIGYYKQFRCCPKNDIRSLYLTHCDEIQNESLKDLVATFLHNLAESDLNINNEDYLLDRSKDFLDSLILKHYTEELNACIEMNDIKRAKNIQAKYKKVAEVETNEVSLFSKDSVKTIQEALSKVDEELMTLPDKLNRVTGKLHRNDFMAILAPPKTGKCLNGNTEVLMADGSFKKAKELVVGDLLMGPDSKPRTVETVNKGFGKMYRIRSKVKRNGTSEIDFTCNGNHILVLKNNSPDRIKPIPQYNANGTPNGEYTKYSKYNFIKEKECEISVEDYIKLSKEQKRHLKLFRTGVDYEEKEHKLSPRFLGIWLGDGTSSCADITNPELEIYNYVKNYGESLSDTFVIRGSKKCPTLGFNNKNNKRKESNVRRLLIELDLLNNKHIPEEYLLDSRKNRLELLAGIIDTDGWASEDNYEIHIMNKTLALDIYRLCRELGFRTNFNEHYKHYNGMYKDTDGWAYSWSVEITGKLSEIPVMVPRKKMADSKKFSSLNNTWTFTVEEVGDDDFYGITIDGDHRFLLADTTVTHNSFFMQHMAVEAVKQGLNVIFVSMEMTREEVVQRMWKMLYGSKSGIIPEGLYKSAKIVEIGDGKYTSELVDIKVKPNSGKSVTYLQKQSRAQNQYKGDIRIIAYPSYQATCEEITDRVEEIAANENFIADVVIIDYADITRPMGGGTELRNQLDVIWKHLRGFAAKFHCLVVTASQTNRSAWKSSNVDGSSIGEDFRKIAQVTSFVSMEQSPKMKEECLMRIRNIAVRNDNVEETCVFPQSLSLGQFMIGNPVLGKDFIFNNGEENGEEE